MAQFLRKELPVRLAQRARDLDSVKSLNGLQGVQRIVSWYMQSFREIVMLPTPLCVESEAAFAQLLRRILKRHGETNVEMARALDELRQRLGTSYDDLADDAELHHKIDTFFFNRIGIRTLIGHYRGLHKKREGVIGIIDQNTVAGAVAREVRPGRPLPAASFTLRSARTPFAPRVHRHRTTPSTCASASTATHRTSSS